MNMCSPMKLMFMHLRGRNLFPSHAEEVQHADITIPNHA